MKEAKFISVDDSLIPSGTHAYWFVFILILLGMSTLLAIEQYLMLIAVVVTPLTFIFLLNLRLSIQVLIISLFIGFSLIEKPIGIKSADIMVLLTILAVLINKVFRGDYSLTRTPLDRPIILFLGAIAISLIDSQNPSRGITNFLRHLELFFLYYVLVEVLGRLEFEKIKKILSYYMGIAILASIIAIIYALLGFQNRAYGITGIPLSDLIVFALIISSSHLILSTQWRQVVKYMFITLILLLELVLTQTRGAWLSYILSFLFIGYLIRRKSIPGTFRRFATILVMISLALLVTFTFFSGIFIGIIHKAEQVTYVEVGTIYFRFILWDAAINVFLANPINGIGLGQFALFSGGYSDMGRSVLFQENLEGLSAHNLVLSYLSESGLIGIIGLFFFFYSIGMLTKKVFNTANNRGQLKIVVPLVTMMFFVVSSSFYAGSWLWGINGIQFMFFLALTVVMSKIRNNR